MSNKIRIFISYARMDVEHVLPLYHRLKEAGFSPWLDQEDILPGVKWRAAIESALREADFFLLCLSPRSSNRRGFIQREVNTALDLWEEKVHGDIYFIPLRLEDCEIPERVDEFQCVNLYESGGWDRLLKALRIQAERLGRTVPAAPATPKPTPPPSPVPSPVIVPTPNSSGPREFEFTTVKLDADGKEIERKKGRARGLVEDIGGGVHLEMVQISGGEFWMGSTQAEAQEAFQDRKRYYKDAKEEWYTAETPRHRVAISPFWMGKYPVTQAQWQEVMGDLPEMEATLRGENHPVVNVSWEEANAFCIELSRRTKQQYRLPTEAEWEYAARAGTTTPFVFGQNINPIFVNYHGDCPFGSAAKGTYREGPVPVGSLGVANAYGLYEVHGNIWEWCSDWYSQDYYAECKQQGIVKDPQGPTMSSDYIIRGGSWGEAAVSCRSTVRNGEGADAHCDDLGFRLVKIAHSL